MFGMAYDDMSTSASRDSSEAENLASILASIDACAASSREKKYLRKRAVEVAAGAPHVGVDHFSSGVSLEKALAMIARADYGDKSTEVSRGSSLTRALKMMREAGENAIASRLSRLSKVRNGAAHPDVELLNDIAGVMGKLRDSSTRWWDGKWWQWSYDDRDWRLYVSGERMAEDELNATRHGHGHHMPTDLGKNLQKMVLDCADVLARMKEQMLKLSIALKPIDCLSAKAEADDRCLSRAYVSGHLSKDADVGGSSDITQTKSSDRVTERAARVEAERDSNADDISVNAADASTIGDGLAEQPSAALVDQQRAARPKTAKGNDVQCSDKSACVDDAHHKETVLSNSTVVTASKLQDEINKTVEKIVVGRKRVKNLEAELIMQTEATYAITGDDDVEVMRWYLAREKENEIRKCFQRENESLKKLEAELARMTVSSGTT